ncbi:hypothetical protein ATO1_17255 [Phaeobacter sp. 22II1-1F12B]|nr:hypothetical protein ATO1_17255 [Phaeobacter sp. 22II1-1F12B]
MALDIEVVDDGGVGGEEALFRTGRLEPNLLPLGAPGGLMRNLCTVVSEEYGLRRAGRFRSFVP